MTRDFYLGVWVGCGLGFLVVYFARCAAILYREWRARRAAKRLAVAIKLSLETPNVVWFSTRARTEERK